MPVRIGPILPVGELIEKAKSQGCELRVSKAKLATPDGPKAIRYLFNPETKGRYDITDIADDESMLGSEIAAVERRLKIKLV